MKIMQKGIAEAGMAVTTGIAFSWEYALIFLAGFALGVIVSNFLGKK